LYYRYIKNKNKLKRLYTVYSQSEHNICDKFIDEESISIIKKLKKNSFQAYIVGGAVRDMLVGLKPKDFDIVTNARPQQIKNIFKYKARIIGKRFKLVHILNDKNSQVYTEVITFRSKEAGEYANNIYGSIEEDVTRRDFTVNALYYDIEKKELLDFYDGLNDIKKRKLKAIIPYKQIFTEDPVRIIRALKYSVKLDLKIPLLIHFNIKQSKALLLDVSRSRISEEMKKILLSSHAYTIFFKFNEYKLLPFLFPNTHQKIIDSPYFWKSLKYLDNKKDKQESDIIWPFLKIFPVKNSKDKLFNLVKEVLDGLIFPNQYIIDIINEYKKRKKKKFYNFKKKKKKEVKNL